MRKTLAGHSEAAPILPAARRYKPSRRAMTAGRVFSKGRSETISPTSSLRGVFDEAIWLYTPCASFDRCVSCAKRLLATPRRPRFFPAARRYKPSRRAMTAGRVFSKGRSETISPTSSLRGVFDEAIWLYTPCASFDRCVSCAKRLLATPRRPRFFPAARRYKPSRRAMTAGRVFSKGRSETISPTSSLRGVFDEAIWLYPPCASFDRCVSCAKRLLATPRRPRFFPAARRYKPSRRAMTAGRVFSKGRSETISPTSSLRGVFDEAIWLYTPCASFDRCVSCAKRLLATPRRPRFFPAARRYKPSRRAMTAGRVFSKGRSETISPTSSLRGVFDEAIWLYPPCASFDRCVSCAKRLLATPRRPRFFPAARRYKPSRRAMTAGRVFSKGRSETISPTSSLRVYHPALRRDGLSMNRWPFPLPPAYSFGLQQRHGGQAP